jgi:multiple sugar transport system substrate-binding protein
MPYVRSTEACYVNKTYVEALGYTLPETLTWDFIWEVSEAALAKNEDGTFRVNNQKALIPFIYKSTDNMMIQALKQMGAGYSTSAGDILLFNEDTTNFLKTVATHAETYAFSTFKIDSYPGNWFNKGQCIFAIDSTAGATWMGHRAPQIDVKPEEMVDFEVEVMTVPQFDPEHPQMISQGPSMCIFNKEDPQEVLASWLFMQYMLTNEVQLAYSGTEGYVPVTEKAQASAEYADYLATIKREWADYIAGNGSDELKVPYSPAVPDEVIYPNYEFGPFVCTFVDGVDVPLSDFERIENYYSRRGVFRGGLYYRMADKKNDYACRENLD